jgi:serine/threonine-protein phosphatase 2A regulatory subunit A
MIKNQHYLYRMTVLMAISMLASVVSQDVLINSMLPVILSAAKDKVRSRTPGQRDGAC